jgi:hypothetical protein
MSVKYSICYLYTMFRLTVLLVVTTKETEKYVATLELKEDDA